MKKNQSLDVLLENNDMSKFLIRHNYSRFGGVFGVILSLAAIVILIVFWGKLVLVQRCALAVLSLMFTVFQPFSLWSKGRKQLKQECFQTPFHYEFGEDKIVVTQGEYKQDFDWNQIRKVVCAKDAIYVYMTAMSAFILPAAQCQDEFLELASWIRDHAKRG